MTTGLPAIQNPNVLRAVELVRPVLLKLGLPILGAPPAATQAPGNVVAHVAKRGLFVFTRRKYNVNARGEWLHLAFDFMHEVAHLIAAEGREVWQREHSINTAYEDEGTLQIEVRLWGSLGRRWTWFRTMAETSFNYSLDGFADYAFESRETKELVKRGLLTPGRETICWDAARTHIHSVRP